MTLQADIQSLLHKFASDLEALVRGAAVGAVQSALGSASVTQRVARSAKPGPRPKSAAKPKPAAKLTTRGGARVRRTPEQIAATADKIAAYVKANPNSGAEHIKKALGIASNQWQGPLGVLIAQKRILAKGAKRSTTYNVAGASSAGNVVLLKRR